VDEYKLHVDKGNQNITNTIGIPEKALSKSPVRLKLSAVLDFAGYPPHLGV
jgi:hypothetical protein